MSLWWTTAEEASETLALPDRVLKANGFAGVFFLHHPLSDRKHYQALWAGNNTGCNSSTGKSQQQ